MCPPVEGWWSQVYVRSRRASSYTLSTNTVKYSPTTTTVLLPCMSLNWYWVSSSRVGCALKPIRRVQDWHMYVQYIPIIIIYRDIRKIFVQAIAHTELWCPNGTSIHLWGLHVAQYWRPPSQRMLLNIIVIPHTGSGGAAGGDSTQVTPAYCMYRLTSASRPCNTSNVVALEPQQIVVAYAHK